MTAILIHLKLQVATKSPWRNLQCSAPPPSLMIGLCGPHAAVAGMNHQGLTTSAGGRPSGQPNDQI